jgi:hypothetical protein
LDPPISATEAADRRLGEPGPDVVDGEAIPLTAKAFILALSQKEEARQLLRISVRGM